MHRMLFVLPIALLTMIVTAAPSTRADDDDSGCERLEGTLRSTLGPNFTTAGKMRGDIEGTTEFVGDPASLVPAGTGFAYAGNFTVTTDDGTLTTQSSGIFEPFAFGLGTQYDTVLSGTGAFSGASGFFYFNFRSDATGTVFTSSYTGLLCGAALDDDDDE